MLDNDLVSLFFKIVDQSGSDGVGVFAINAETVAFTNFANAFIITSLNSRVNFLVVHDIGLEKNDRAEVDAVGEQIPAPDVGVAVHRFGIVTGVGVGRKSCAATHGFGNFFSHGELIVVGALQQAQQQLQSFVILFDFALTVTTVDQDVVVIFAHKVRFFWIAPGFGIKMQTDNKIRFQLVIDLLGAGADFTAEVKKALGSVLKFVSGGLATAGQTGEPFLSFGLEVLTAQLGDRLGIIPGEGDAGTKSGEISLHDSGNFEGHIPLGDGEGVFANAVPALFNLGEFPADVAGVDDNVQVGEGLWRVQSRAHFPRWCPVTQDFGCCGRGFCRVREEKKIVIAGLRVVGLFEDSGPVGEDFNQVSG